MIDLPTPEETRFDGVSCHPIRLADGNTWGFANPTIRLRPKVICGVDRLGRPAETIAVAMEFGYSLEIQRLAEAMWTASENDPPAKQYESFFALASALLRRAHDIDLSTACFLLAVSDQELPQLISEVVTVATGGRLGQEVDPQSKATNG